MELHGLFIMSPKIKITHATRPITFTVNGNLLPIKAVGPFPLRVCQ